MNGIKKVILQALLTLLWSFTANGLQCLDCRDMPKPEDCRIVTTCSGSSQCYVEQVVSSGGLILYNLGCLSTSRCKSKRSLDSSSLKIRQGSSLKTRQGSSLKKRQGTVSVTDIVTCVDCCDDDFCNIEGCTTTAVRQPQRPPMCFSCMSQLDPQSCRDVRLCEPDQMCALIETVPFSSHQWSSQCAPKLQCQILGNQSLAFSGRLCYRCCQDDFCNNDCNRHPSTQTTVSPTSTKSNTIVTKTLSTPATVFTPTKHTTTTLPPPVTTLTPTKYPLSTGITALSTAPVHVVNKTVITNPTISSTFHTSQVISNSATTDILQTPDSTVPLYTSTLSNISSATPSSASSKPSNILPTTPQRSSSENIHVHTSPVTLTSKAVPSTVSSAFPNKTSILTTTSKTTIQSPSLSASITPNTTDGCINRTFDICFVIDSSGSLGQNGFEKELQFISELVKTIAMETKATTHFCVVTFSTDAHVFIKLTKFSTVDQVINAIGNIPYRTGETYTHLGLKQALHAINRNGRLGAEKEIILLTDGTSNEPQVTLHVAEQIKREGIELYAVGIGPQTNGSELQQIVSDKTHLYEVPDIGHLNTSYIDIIQALCKSANFRG